MESLPQVLNPDEPIFTISVAAALADMHPQTLRTYDRMGLVIPGRTKGRGRRYSPRDVRKLRLIQQLSQEDGVNLTGIRRILDLQEELEFAQNRIEQLTELVQVLSERGVQGPRVFTAASTGAVYHGRYARIRTPLALSAGDESGDAEL